MPAIAYGDAVVYRIERMAEGRAICHNISSSLHRHHIRSQYHNPFPSGIAGVNKVISMASVESLVAEDVGIMVVEAAESELGLVAAAQKRLSVSSPR